MYGGILLLSAGLYVPFRLLASHTNNTLMAGTDDFYYSFAVFLWPSYVLLATGLVFLTSGALGFSLVVDFFALVLLMACSDYASGLDRFLGLNDMGDAGFLTTAMGGTWNTTWLSQALCFVTLWLGLIVGKTTGVFLHRRLCSQVPQEQRRRVRDWRVIAAHVLNAGFAAPALAYACAVVSWPGADHGIKTATDAGVYLTIMALGYAGGTAFSLGFAVRGLGLRRPGRCALLTVALFTVGVCGWGWLSYIRGGWGGARLIALCAFSVVVVVAFALVTRRSFLRRRADAGQASA
jgi:heme exporter protein D